MAQYMRLGDPKTGQNYRLARMTIDVAGYDPIKRWALVPSNDWGSPVDTSSPDQFIIIHPPVEYRTRADIEKYLVECGWNVTGGGTL